MLKGIRTMKVQRPALRARLIALRLSGEDRKRLEQLARKQGVGVSTFARMIIEAYVRTHSSEAR
jgi:predicted DNA binding CopG/RHH family protein